MILGEATDSLRHQSRYRDASEAPVGVRAEDFLVLYNCGLM